VGEEQDERAVIAALQQRPSALLVLARVLAVVTGSCVIGIGLLLAAIIVQDLLTARELGYGGAIILFIVSVFTALGGLVVARWGLPKDRVDIPPSLLRRVP
jgi:hypothetical protein